ncbi:WHG domain-containing protein [Spongisporangium articulatum]|uniref:WHG domain-containing protein n=1 Tax=Spongisporangium articulatum TaxID=3362603 RepID=A0ABW8ANJ5_9ACTN
MVAEAASAADELGLEALTLAVVAQRLGVRQPSLYNHVEGLRGLRRELTLLGGRELLERGRAAAVGRSGREALFAIAEAYRTYGRERPALFSALQRVPDAEDAELVRVAQELLDLFYAVLAGYHLEGDDAVDAVRGLRALVIGWVTLETGGGFGMPRDVDRSFHRLLESFDAGLAARRV